MKNEFIKVFSLIGTYLLLNSCSVIDKIFNTGMVLGIFIGGLVLFVILVIALQKITIMEKSSKRDGEFAMKKDKNWFETFASTETIASGSNYEFKSQPPKRKNKMLK